MADNNVLRREAATQTRPRRISLRLKLTALAVLVSALPIAFVGAVLIDINQDALEQTLREHFYTVIEDISSDAETTFARTQDGMEGIARVLSNRSLELDTRIEMARSLVTAYEAISVVALYDENAALVDVFRERSAPEMAMPEALDAAMVERAVKRGRAFGKAELIAGAPRVLLAVPVYGKAATWLAVSYVSLAPLQHRIEDLVDQRPRQLQHTVLVADERFRAVAHSDREKAESLASVESSPVFVGVDARALDEGVLVFRDLPEAADGGVVAAVGSLRSVPWAVAVELPRELAYSSFVTMRIWVIVVVCVVILVAMLAAVFLARRITAPIKTLVGFADELAARRFEKRVDIRTRDELSVLGAALSGAATQLEASERRIRDEMAIRSDLGRYLPEKLVDQIVRRKQSMALGGQRRRVTVLFADVAGFTPLVEKHSADEVVTILNELFTILTEIIFRHGGTVDKFIGDCVMAFWGAPDEQSDHAARALAAAEDMQHFLDVGNAGWEQRFGTRIELAIGVNTGEAVIGNFGSESRMEYTAIGDVVNVAARLEAIARPQQILISDATRQAAGDGFEYREMGSHSLAGKSQQVELFEVRV